MPGETRIEWTRGDDGTPGASWNPVTGCTKVSAGCEHCYAERLAERFRGVAGHPYEQGFDLRLWPERLAIPLRWRKSKRIFVNSMSDLFHAGVPEAFIEDVFAVMAAAPRHVFLVLTKRPQRLQRTVASKAFSSAVATKVRRLHHRHRMLGDEHPSWPGWPLPNVWLGVSVESQEVTHRIDWLVRTPAAVRFLSCEPLLGPLDLEPWLWDGPLPPVGGGRWEGDDAGPAWAGRNPCPDLGWVIAGGESGPGFRRVDPDWVRDLRDQCVQARVPFFWKQWGGLRPTDGGRELDGRTWDEFPAGVA